MSFQFFLKRFSLPACIMLLISFVNPPLLHAEQSARLQGQVIDSTTASPIFGVSVLIQEAKGFGQTDFDGKYSIAVAPGDYTVVFQMVGYSPVTRNITVTPGVTKVNVTLGVQTMKALEVQGRALNNTESSMLNLQKKSAVVSDGISSEAIKKSPDSNAGDVLKRVTGITLIGGKYVFVRGLGERYSNTELNGSVLPSPEPDKRVVPMDIFPASLIKNIRVVKGFLPEDSGEFSGGLVKVETIDYPDEFTASVGIGSGMNSNSTGKGFKTFSGGGNDYLGLYKDGLLFGNNLGTSRYDLPSLVEKLVYGMVYASSRTVGKRGLPEQLVKTGMLELPNNWDTKTIAAPVDQKFNFSIGDSLDWSRLLPGMRFGFIYGTSYSHKYTIQDKKSIRYAVINLLDRFTFPEVSRLAKTKNYDMRTYSEKVLWGHNLNLSLDITHGQQIYAKTLFSIQSNKDVSTGTGYRYYQDENLIMQNQGFIARNIFSEVVGGKHAIQPSSAWEPHKLEWSATYALANRYAPDQKVQTWKQPASATTLQPYSRYSGGTDGIRYWDNSTDTTRQFQASYEIPFKQWDGLTSKFKIGGLALHREKYFNFFRLQYDVGNDGLDYLNLYPVGGNLTFHPARMWDDANSFGENDPGNNAFRAGQRLQAWFGQVDLPIAPRVRFVGGLRHEDSYQFNLTYDRQYELDASRAYQYNCGNVDKGFYYPVLQAAKICPLTDSGFGELHTKDDLPSANLVWEVRDDMNLRTGYSETVTRPDLRELSQFLFQSSYLADATTGNPNLKRSYIHNYDLRWEWYLNKNDYAGVGLFYKNISSPIELVGKPYSDDKIAYSYYNAKKGYIKGIELEYRRDFLKFFRGEVNLFLISSHVEIMDWWKWAMTNAGVLGNVSSDAALAPTSISRSLQGQSPYVVNMKIFFYPDSEKKHEFGLYYNVFGKRIAYVGTDGAPDVYEQATGLLDISYRYSATDHLDIKLTGKNLTDARFKKIQRNALLSRDELFESYRKGVDWNLSISYKF